MTKQAGSNPNHASGNAIQATNTPMAEGQAGGRDDEAERRLMRRIAYAIPITTMGAASVLGFVFDLGTAILALAFGMLIGSIAIFWASIRTLSGDVAPSLEEALAMSAPVAAEQQKRAVLRALRDLDYERTMGKISETDYAALRERYRAEAKRLLKTLDDDLGPLRIKAEAHVAARLGRANGGPQSTPVFNHHCPQCKTINDRDAVFCKKCGTRLPIEDKTSHAIA